MDLENFLKNLGVFSVAFLAIASFFGWLVKSVVTYFINLDIENYKKKLNLESAKEIEQLKSQLQITAKQNEIRFSNLHEKRAEAIQTLYSQLYFLVALSKGIALRLEDLDTHGKEETFNLCDTYSIIHTEILSNLLRNKLLLSENISQSILKVMAFEPHPFIYKSVRDYYDINPEETMKMIKDIRTFEKGTPEIMKELEKEFQKIIGVEE